MKDKFLIDTSVWVKCFRGMDSSLQNRVASLVMEKRACTSEVIVMEILRGAKSEKEFDMLHEDFIAMPQLTLNHDAWETAWKTAYKLRKSGVNVPMADVLISAIAIFHKCTLMHSDKHFNFIAKHTGLKAIEI